MNTKALCVIGFVAANTAGCNLDAEGTAKSIFPSSDAGLTESGISCGAGAMLCGDHCTSTLFDPNNCGSCGRACPSGQSCSEGNCVLQCSGGSTRCSDYCVTTQVDPFNCGGCGIICDINERCVAGTCTLECVGGTVQCGATCTNTQVDPAHCGSCYSPCKTGELCEKGECVFACVTGRTACDNSCVDLQTDAAHCGKCTTKCGDKQACNAGKCELSCEANLLGAALGDPWGQHWDALERPPSTLAVASATCESIGARLPVPTELYRASGAKSGALGPPYAGTYVWSAVPYSQTAQYILRLSDGLVSTNHPDSPLSYRCVCSPTPKGVFAGSACQAPEGKSCFGLTAEGKRRQIDSEDRVALHLAAAERECALLGAHVADYLVYLEAIPLGLPGGSGQLAHTADIAQYIRNTLIKWTGTELSWTAASGTDSGSVGPLYARPFRCVGANYAAGVHPNALANEFVGPAGVLKGETVDRLAASYVAALDTCNKSGGHLPRVSEMAELIQQGLPAGSDLWLWTADSLGKSYSQFLTAVVKWTPKNPHYDFTYPAFLYSRIKNDPDIPFRCVYYPLDLEYAGPKETDCSGGCALFAQGTKPAKIWIDNKDRPAAVVGEAARTCASVGGHLASERDLAEAIRQGLPNGSGSPIVTWDYGLGDVGAQVAAVKWSGVNKDFTDLFPEGLEGAALSAPLPYRCLWSNELR